MAEGSGKNTVLSLDYHYPKPVSKLVCKRAQQVCSTKIGYVNALIDKHLQKKECGHFEQRSVLAKSSVSCNLLASTKPGQFT